MRVIVTVCTIVVFATILVQAPAQAPPLAENSVEAKPYPLEDLPVVALPVAGPQTFDTQSLQRLEKQEQESRARMIATAGTLAPSEYATYRKAVESKDFRNTARAAVAMLSKVQDAASKPSAPIIVGQCEMTAWELCIGVLKETNDSDAQPIIEKWSRGLREENNHLERQCYATRRTWDRRLLTDDFWRLFQESQKRQTMCAVCYVVDKHGIQEDVKRLEKMRDAMEVDDKHRPLLANLVIRMRYRLAGGDPFAAPPSLFVEYPRDLGPVPPEFQDW